jgi:hypothetical protein
MNVRAAANNSYMAISLEQSGYSHKPRITIKKTCSQVPLHLSVVITFRRKEWNKTIATFPNNPVHSAIQDAGRITDTSHLRAACRIQMTPGHGYAQSPCSLQSCMKHSTMRGDLRFVVAWLLGATTFNTERRCIACTGCMYIV